LGLPISHQIIQDLGGSLTAENLHDPDRVRFTIALPTSGPRDLMENGS
jgi:C4-dicarboxylate-specific signal transduction histidine kinase